MNQEQLYIKCIAGLEKYFGLIKSKYSNLKNQLGFLQTNPFFSKNYRARIFTTTM